MVGFIQPCKARVRSCFLKGVDLTQYTHCVRIYETLLKPYLTAHLTIIDNNNLIENMNIVGGEECQVTFDAPPNNQVIYNATVYVLSLKGQQSPNNLKTQIYEIDFVGPQYFQDKGNLVQKGFGQQTGTAAIASIWGQFMTGGLNIPVPSIGMIGKQNDPSTIDNKKPFAAIDQIKKMLTFGAYKTGTPLLYHDNKQPNLVPLEHLFATLSSQQLYIQKETWGANFFDNSIYNAIIAAQAQVDAADGEKSTGGRSSMMDIAGALNQGQVVFDMFNGTISKFAQAAKVAGGQFSGSSVGSIAGGIAGNIFQLGAGGLGGAPNIQTTHSNRWDRGSAPDTKTMAERLYSAEARGGPQLQIKVPLQTGLFSTVGKGVTVQLIPPFGDLTNGNPFSSQMSGDWLVKDLVHEVYTDNREVQGTTAMQLMRGGLNT